MCNTVNRTLEASKTALEAENDADLRVPCYCEENVWRLAYRLMNGDGEEQRNLKYHVVFVSNPEKCVPMFQQLAIANPFDPCFWDYHVVLFQTSPEGTRVHDIDSHLPYKIPLKEYLESLTCVTSLLTLLMDMDSVIEAPIFLKNFSSDRSHMYNEESKEWNAPPPHYACIQTENENNIAKFFTISEENREDKVKDETLAYGAVYSLSELKVRFGLI
eukprot:scaffold1062_cov130-Cylindrotheca_fusiformis.AAC.34